jgi:hypothetical protein
MLPTVLPMLATASSPFDASPYSFEVKWDGVRMLAAVEASGWRLWGRAAASNPGGRRVRGFRRRGRTRPGVAPEAAPVDRPVEDRSGVALLLGVVTCCSICSTTGAVA